MAFKLTEPKMYREKFQKKIYRKMHLKALLVFYPGIRVSIIKYSSIEKLFQNHVCNLFNPWSKKWNLL